MSRESAQILREAIGEAVTLSAWIKEKRPKRFTGVLRHKVAVALASLAIQHREAAVLLFMSEQPASAFALSRSVYEATFRARWMYLCATDKQCEDALRTGKPPSFEKTVIRGLQKLDPAASTAISKTKSSAWGGLSDFSHGGIQTIGRWISTGDVGPSYSDSDILKMIGFLDLHALLSSILIAEIGTLPVDEQNQKLKANVDSYARRSHMMRVLKSLPGTRPD